MVGLGSELRQLYWKVSWLSHCAISIERASNHVVSHALLLCKLLLGT